MDDIDRISEEALGRIFEAMDDGVEIAPILRAALLEYGAIVREECAKKCDAIVEFFGDDPDDELHALHARDIGTARDLAAAIRKAG